METTLEQYAFDNYPASVIPDKELRQCWAIVEKLLPQSKRYSFSLAQLEEDMEESRDEGWQEDWGRPLEYGTFEIGIKDGKFMAVFTGNEYYCSADDMLKFLKEIVEDWKNSVAG